MYHITYNEEPPEYRDCFYQICKFIDKWNKYMQENFILLWVTCLDESMLLWTNMFTYPGFVFCPRNPWEIGNEYHTIACTKSNITFFAKLLRERIDLQNFLNPTTTIAVERQ